MEVHLQVEMGILRKWKEKDFAEVKGAAPNYFPSIRMKEEERKKESQ